MKNDYHKKRIMKRRVLLCCILLFAAVVSSFGFLSPQETFAYSESELMKKLGYNMLRKMYANNVFKTPIDLSDTTTFPYSTFELKKVVKDSPKIQGIAPTYANSDSDLTINKDSNMELFNGKTIRSGVYFPGLLAGVSGYTPQNLGYTPDASAGGSSTKCVTLTYNKVTAWGPISHHYATPTEVSSATTNSICFPVTGDDIIDAPSASSAISSGSKCSTSDIGCMEIGYDGYALTRTVIGAHPEIRNASTGPTPTGRRFSEYLNDLSSEVSSYGSPVAFVGSDSYPLMAEGDDGSVMGAQSSSAPAGGVASNAYKITSTSGAATTALQYITGVSSANFDDYAITDDDYYGLYKSYVDYVFPKYSLTLDTSNCSTNKNEISGYVWTKDGTNWCKINGDVSSVSERFGYRYDSTALQAGSFADVLTSAKSLNMGEVSGGSFGEIGTPSGGDPSDPSGGAETSETPLCTRASGVLSWFFCPVLDFVGNTVGKIYEWIEDSFLAIPASLMTAGGDNGTYGGWKQFRDFANILFAILFAVVILSQITGIGISNYNIKKMLPRLIMVVVLVNVSFILCQLAVDLSNIVGHGLNTMLRGFAGEDPFTLGGASTLTQALVSGTESDVTSALGGAAGGFLGGLAITAIGVATIRLWILPLFLALVSALVAVAFFFLILGVRQAGIILLVVLAPMAIVCYALPNTKSLFDKWWKVFSALLMVYPICGAMMGGGTFAASILIDNDPDNFFSLIIAMLLTIVPFFFVPTILKNSLNGIAMLGNKLSTLGSQAGRGASKGIERSHGFQDAQQQMQFSRARASLKRQTALRGIGSSLAKTRAGKAVAGAAGAISQYGDRHKILGAGIRGVRGIGQAAADASQRKYLRNAKTAALSDRQQYEANNADAYLTGEVSRQRATDISNAKARYLDPKNSPIDTGDFASMQQEYEKQLDALLADPEDDSAIANVAALQDILSATDDGAAVMMSTLATKANQHSGTEDGQKALRKAATNIDAGAFKGRNRNYYKMATDFANGNFSQVRNGLGTYDSGVKDKDGNKLPPLSYLKAYHDSPAGLKYSAANFGSLDNSAYQQILNGIQKGEITGTNLQNLMETVNEAMSNDNIHLDNNAAGYAQQILSAGYAQTAQPTTGGGTGGSGGTGTPSVARTAGSQAIAHAASAKSISNLTRSVQLGTDPKKGGIGTDDAVNIASNMLTAVRDNSNSFTQDQLDAMKSYVSAVNQRGTDSSGQPINFDTREFDSAQINVHGGKTAPAATSAPVSNTSTPSTRPGAVPGTQIIQTPGPNGSTTTQVRGWSGQPIGGSNTVTTNGGIILTGDAADQWRRNNQGGNGSGGSATP